MTTVSRFQLACAAGSRVLAARVHIAIEMVPRLSLYPHGRRTYLRQRAMNIIITFLLSSLTWYWLELLNLGPGQRVAILSQLYEPKNGSQRKTFLVGWLFPAPGTLIRMFGTFILAYIFCFLRKRDLANSRLWPRSRAFLTMRHATPRCRIELFGT